MFERVRGHTVARPVSTSAGRANSEQTPSRSIASIEGSIIHAGYAVPQTERLYKLRHLFISGACPTRQQLLRDLEVSPATLKRDLAHLRDRMNMPIVWDRDRGGWRLDTAQPVVGTQYELPGLWFSAEEIHALLTMQHLLSHLDAGGLLGPHIAPLMQRLSELLGTGAPSRVEVARRIRVQTVGARRMHLPHFQAVGSALLRRHRLHIEYLQRWVHFWFDEPLRLHAARMFQRSRLNRVRNFWRRQFNSNRNEPWNPDLVKLDLLIEGSLRAIDDASDQTVLLTDEARLSKQLYRLAANATGYGDFSRSKNGESTDLANRFLDHGNYLAYGLGATATWVLGLPHGLAVLHGKRCPHAQAPANVHRRMQCPRHCSTPRAGGACILRMHCLREYCRASSPFAMTRSIVSNCCCAQTLKVRISNW